MTETAPVEYTKLPGSGISRKGGTFIAAARISTRLWLGDDHLLQVESAGGYSENYKRFYFRDIQAFCLRRTKNWFAVNVVLGFLTGGFLLWTLGVNEPAGKITLGIITAIFGFFLFLNLLRGPTCSCHLRTAVQHEELPSLRRVRNAEKVMGRIRPLIEAAQGTAQAEAMAEQYSSALAIANATAAAPGQATRLVDPTIEIYDSKSHKVLFLVLLGMMIADTFYIVAPSVVTVLFNMLVTAALAMCVLWALVKQNNTDLKQGIRTVTWLTCGYTVLSYMVGYVAMFILIPGQQMDGTQWAYIKALAKMKPMQTPGWLTTLLISASVSGILGIAGLLFLRQHWREKNPV
jgi:hypothetical protein